ncbi:hypothetical protein HMPREF9440_00870 [Sutterella parvirubra YIT 11816]|uniref:Uncharacterized protein n=1 Tax=Sutterella parvirubra YIT 11816 TaxID=762967 RepID=H3KDQ9_9BURK|nr:hypothetical protein HMPREF9440_00870 [Sutterella parvirubra YIT 11816]
MALRRILSTHHFREVRSVFSSRFPEIQLRTAGKSFLRGEVQRRLISVSYRFSSFVGLIL